MVASLWYDLKNHPMSFSCYLLHSFLRFFLSISPMLRNKGHVQFRRRRSVQNSPGWISRDWQLWDLQNHWLKTHPFLSRRFPAPTSWSWMHQVLIYAFLEQNAKEKRVNSSCTFTGLNSQEQKAIFGEVFVLAPQQKPYLRYDFNMSSSPSPEFIGPH